MKLAKLQIIYDRDHGTACYGWYIRTRATDGAEMDTPTDPYVSADSLGCLSQRAESTLRGTARRQARREGYTVPSGFPVEIHS